MKIKFRIGKTQLIIAPRAVFLLWIIIGLCAFFAWKFFLPKDLFTIKNSQGTTVKKIENEVKLPVSASEIEKIKEQYRNKFVLIFFYDGYSSQSSALAQVQVLKATLDIVEPFKSYSDMVVTKVFTTDSQKCRVKETGSVKLLICDKKLIDSFRQLGIDHFKLVILSPLEFSSTAITARGSNSWITLSTFNKGMSQESYNRFLGLQFAQNLGVSLGLSQEGTVSNKDMKSLEQDPNCAENEIVAKAWWGLYTKVFKEVGYYKGCNGDNSLIYPEQDTLMSQSPKKENYGHVSEDYLKQVLTCFYGNGEKVKETKIATYSATLSSCSLFKSKYPKFWTE